MKRRRLAIRDRLVSVAAVGGAYFFSTGVVTLAIEKFEELADRARNIQPWRRTGFQRVCVYINKS